MHNSSFFFESGLFESCGEASSNLQSRPAGVFMYVEKLAALHTVPPLFGLALVGYECVAGGGPPKQKRMEKCFQSLLSLVPTALKGRYGLSEKWANLYGAHR